MIFMLQVMSDYNEYFLQYLWKIQGYDQKQEADWDAVKVIHPGFQNKDSGPDFFNAKVKIGATLWAGNVEIHAKSSDWYKHGHHQDAAYANTILHIVETNDKAVYDYNGREVPTFEISANKHLLRNFENLQESPAEIACSSDIKHVSELEMRFCIEKMRIERFEQRTAVIEQMLRQTKNNWQQVFYVLIARSFGMGVNADPFQMLAENLPLQLIAKHADSLFQLETLLFGQAGMLSGEEDKYSQSLAKEYRFLGQKYNLQPMDVSLWKYARMHPSNFPCLRIAQFANLLHLSRNLFSQILEKRTVEELFALFPMAMSEYWHMHHQFGKLSKRKHKTVAKATVNKLIINAVVPLLFVYGRHKKMVDVEERAVQFLETLEAEQNFVVKNWAEIGFNAENASDSQALVHLYKKYCQPRFCLDCCIGNKLVHSQF